MSWPQKMPVLISTDMSSLPFNDKKGCPPNFHKRSAYTSRKGHRVPPRCVRSATVYRESRKNYTRRVLAKQAERLKAIGKSATYKKGCPPGKIERRGYVRKFGTSILSRGYTVKRVSGKQYRVYPAKSSVYVKPGCVKDRGLPGKLGPPRQGLGGIPTRQRLVGPGEGFGPMRKGELKKHGYVYSEPDHVRHEALNKAVKEFGALGVFHKLDAITKLSKRTAPRASHVFKDDRAWLLRHYKLKV